MVVLAVTGSASRSLPPQLGTVRLRVETEGEERAPVVQAVLALHGRLSTEAQAFVDSGAAIRLTAEQVRAEVRREWDEEQRRNRLRHAAVATLTVRFQDIEALAAWAAEVAALDEVAVEGITWALTRDARRAVERELRIEAVRDAARRAEDYAAAIGAAGVELQQLWEPGLRGASGGGRWEAQSARVMAGWSDGPLRLQPEPIELEASITADFTTI